MGETVSVATTVPPCCHSAQAPMANTETNEFVPSPPKKPHNLLFMDLRILISCNFHIMKYSSFDLLQLPV